MFRLHQYYISCRLLKIQNGYRKTRQQKSLRGNIATTNRLPDPGPRNEKYSLLRWGRKSKGAFRAHDVRVQYFSGEKKTLAAYFSYHHLLLFLAIYSYKWKKRRTPVSAKKFLKSAICTQQGKWRIWGWCWFGHLCHQWSLQGTIWTEVRKTCKMTWLFSRMSDS